MEELVRAAETLRPVVMLRAAVGSVTFRCSVTRPGDCTVECRRENSGRQEVAAPVWQGGQEEDLSLEHWARLEDVFILHDRGQIEEPCHMPC